VNFKLILKEKQKVSDVAIAMFNEIKAVYPSQPSLTREGD
jgi:hypothetical protein